MAKSRDRRPGVAHAIALAALALCWIVAPKSGLTQSPPKKADGAAKPVSSGNAYNDQLVAMTPEARAAKLARIVGGACIGTNPFLMGVTKQGRAKGYAYWSVQCAGGTSYLIQVAPHGQVVAMDCQTLKQNGEGRECYKTF